MFFIKKKLITLYRNPNKINIYTKNQSNIITKETFGKCFFIYNGRLWIKKQIDNHYYLYKPVGSLKNTNTKKISIYRVKKDKKRKVKTSKHKKK